MATVAATGAGIALPLLCAATAQAATPTDTWDRVALCETGGMWHANSGNGFYGGLAITQDTWDQYGGDAYAKRPDLASQTAQRAVADAIFAQLGPGAWPGCEQDTGLLQDTTTDATPALPGEHTPSDVPTTDPSAPSTTPAGSNTDPSAPQGTPTTPAVPATPTTGTAADPGGSPATAPVTPGAPATPVTSVPPVAVTPPPVTPDPGGATTLAPTDPSGAAPGVPDTTAGIGVGSGPGRHGKPYSPTDEELAARDQATRTQVFSVTDGAPTTATTAGSTGSTDTANNSDDSGTSSATRYTVGSGDSLSGIATAQHVDGGWRHLFDVNHQAIGDNPNLIKPGQIINIG